jgi:TolB-like protein
MTKDVIDTRQINDELDRILSSKSISQSPILSRFLRFVVNETIAGRDHLIKEYTIGTEVLGRDGQFMSQSDASVRIHAIRLRKALDEYYRSAASNAVVRIEIPKGSYKPVFSYFSSKEVNGRTSDEYNVIPEHSICIVPFSGFINNDSFDFSTIGFCEYMSEKLSLFQDISVFSFQSIYSYIQLGGKVQELGDDFGVTYYLTGSLEMDDYRILVSVQLYDGKSNLFIWSHDFRAEIINNSLMDMVEDISSKIVSSLAGYSGYIHNRMFNQGKDLPEISNKVANAIFWFYRHQVQHSEQGYYQAVDQLEKAIGESPDCALCYAVLAHLYADGLIYNYSTVPDPIPLSQSYIAKSLALDPNCQHAYLAQAWIHILLKNKAEAAESIRKCYSLNPNSSFFVATSILGNTLLGDYDVALEMHAKAINLSPLPYWWMSVLKIFLAFKKGNYQEVLFHAQKKGTPKVNFEYVFEMIACYYLQDKVSLEKYVRLHHQKYPGGIEYLSKALPAIIFDQELNQLLTRAFDSVRETYFSGSSAVI